MQRYAPCTLCNTSNFRVIHQKDRWQYLRCVCCGLVSLYPRPTTQELINSYDTYLPVQPVNIAEWKKMMQPVVDASADLIESRNRTGRGSLLDIGCGYGFFLGEMKSRGWEVKGIEISETGRQYARHTWDIKVYSEPLENLSLPDRSFDVVTLLYVIEHVLDPPGLLETVKRILKPCGMVLLRWPHSTPIVRMVGPFAKRLDLYHTPFHMYDFSPDTMKRLLERAGFEDIEMRVTGSTLPSKFTSRWASILSGKMGEVLYALSFGHFLLPGVSKTTVAFKLG